MSIGAKAIIRWSLAILVSYAAFAAAADDDGQQAAQKQMDALMRENKRLVDELERAKGEILKLQQNAIVAKDNLDRAKNEMAEKDAESQAVFAAILARLSAETPSVVKSLADCLRDKHEDVAWQAAIALGKIGKKAEAALPALNAATKDERKRVAQAASEALKEIER